MPTTQQINKNYVTNTKQHDVNTSNVVNAMNGITIAGDTNTNGHHHSPNVSADTNGYHHHVNGTLKAIPDPLPSPQPASLPQNQASGR